MLSFYGRNALALIRPIDLRTSRAALVNASTAHGGRTPVSSSISRMNSSSVIFCRPLWRHRRVRFRWLMPVSRMTGQNRSERQPDRVVGYNRN